jgi:hypothetical protein
LKRGDENGKSREEKGMTDERRRSTTRGAGYRGNEIRREEKGRGRMRGWVQFESEG